MKILGITGGVGSGKSRVLNDLKENYNAYIVEADLLAHTLMEPGNSIYNKIIDVFGKDILYESYPYEIDRKKLGNIVFNNNEKLNILNQIVHPLVKKEILNLINKVKKENLFKFFVIEAALLIQDGYKEICDEIWYIWVDREERIKRLIKQRGYTKEKCISIFESQASDEFYINHSDYVINNQNDYEESRKLIKARLNKFLKNDIIK